MLGKMRLLPPPWRTPTISSARIFSSTRSEIKPSACAISSPQRASVSAEKRLPSGNDFPWKLDPSLCHPERTRISYFTALAVATYVVLPKENHMQLIEAATLDRKSGGAEGSAVPRIPPGNVFDSDLSRITVSGR
jgi:hypothetical protein